MQSIAEVEQVDPLQVLELARANPELVLQWVYQNLSSPPDKLDQAWVESIYRGARNSTGLKVSQEFSLALQLRRFPVDIETFLFDPYYLAKDRREIYPVVLEELRKINNPQGLRIVNPYTEGVFTGGIGSAKSTTALYTNAYQLYVLSCFENPQYTFGLDSASEILFAFLAMAGDAAGTDYERFRQIVCPSPYFQIDFPYNKRLESELHFPHTIQVVPKLNTIGKNVIGGMIDEINFGVVIENSKRAIDGGTYNQALTTYNGLARRRKSRFLTSGSIPGILCLVSSKRYPGEFTDLKLQEAKEDPTIYVYDKRVWDIKPEGTYSGKVFEVFPGAPGKKPCLVTPEIVLSEEDREQVVTVPVEFKREFEQDLIGSLRDIAGVSTIARYPYFTDVNAVAKTFSRRSHSILSSETTDFETAALQFYPKLFSNLGYRRWVHVDLGVVSDHAGIACGYVRDFVVGQDDIGLMPQIEIDFILRVAPPRNGEIKFHRIRKMLISLRDAGLPITWVSFDAFQSVDSIQLLRQQGFLTGRQQVDQNASFYSVLKTCIYAGRLLCPPHNWCQLELLKLERDSKSGKIDHPPRGTKDCADALAGVVYGLTMRREIWMERGVPFTGTYSSVREVKVHNGQPE